MSTVQCPACGARGSDLNPRCAACGAVLPDESFDAEVSHVVPGESDAAAGAGRGAGGAAVAIADPVIDPLALLSTVAVGVADGPAGPASSPLDRSGTGPVPALHPGQKLGRFVVLAPLGEGGMGVVVSAHDPRLDRTVAIKVLSADPLAGAVSSARERPLREAKAMAKITHPNVVTVYEVDVLGDHVAIVMELVRGRTLRAWLGEAVRSQREILGAFVQAGRGLLEVHRAGLVHRDFKPDNVLVGDDGRVAVTDFGLVGLTGALPTPPVERDAAPIGAPQLTRTGSLLGTPAYMAPEQHERGPVDERADQFAFCVALHEALHGERPFAGESYEDLRTAVLAGAVRPPPSGTRVPAHVRRALRRGLSRRREDRHPSMAALLADLEKDPSKARWQALGAALVLGLAGLAASRFVWPPEAAPVCRGGEDRLAGVWDAGVKARVRAAFKGTGRPYSEDTASRVEAILDEKARAWVAMYTDSCEATHVRGEQSAHLLDLRAHCLDRRRAELSALGALLSSEPAPDLLDRAVPLARSLSSLDDCQKTDRLLEAVPLPADPAVRARLEQLRARLEEARALRTAKRHAVGLPIAAAVVDEATTLDHAPLLAEALALRGRLQLDAGDFKGSETTLREAAKIAARAREDRLAATVWTDLVHVIGARQRRDAEAAALVPVAESAVERAGGDALPKAELLDVTANLRRVQGSHPEAMAKAEQAVVLFEQVRGPDDLLLAGALDTLGSIYSHLARYGDAEARHERALAIRERVLGPDHPDIARALVNLANALYGRGKLREARSRYERALAIQEKALGPEHPYLTIVLNNLGSLLSDLGDHEGALSLHHRTLAIAVRQYGAEHVEPSISHHNIGVVLDLQEKPAEARPHYERALVLREKFLGREHIQTAETLGRLGKVLCEQGAEREGSEKLERTIAIHEKALGKDDPTLVKPLMWLAVCDRRARKGPASLVRLERALALQVAASEDGDPVELADVQVELARALWDAGNDKKRAASLMEKAAATYATEGELYAKELERARAWIKAHP